MRIAWALALMVAAGCGDDGSIVADAATADGPNLECDPGRTRVVPDGEPIEVGSFCDEVLACVADADAAAALEAVAPGFACASGAGTSCGGFLCQRDGGGGEITQEDYEQICAITVLAEPPDEVVCMVFL